MKDSRYSYYVPTHVTIHTGHKITVVMDYGQSGVITKHLVQSKSIIFVITGHNASMTTISIPWQKKCSKKNSLNASE